MKIRGILVGLASVVLLTLTVCAAEKVKLDGIKCAMKPKNAAKANKSLDFKGGKVYFCCDNCPKGFAKFG